VLGTGEYLAPEQASGKPVSPATDVYSLGVVLWELLAGDVPFSGENFVAVALRHVNELPPDLRTVRPDVSPRLAAAVERALAKDPAQRFPSMAALAAELRACLAEPEEGPPPPVEDDGALTLVTKPAQAPRPRPRRAARQPRRRRTLWAVLLALAAAAAAFAAVFLVAGSGHTHHGGSGGGGGGSGGAVSLRGLSGYDPQGDGSEHSEEAANATDGSSATFWETEHYNSQDFGGLKDGVGLMLDAGRAVKLSQLTVTTPTPGFTAEIQAGDSSAGGFTADSSSRTVSGSTATFPLNGATGRYYVIWITQLPPEGRAEISKVTAKS
jgi:hypothetical protein